MNNTVTACVDGSLSTRSVCEYAAWAARTLQSQLALLHVIEKDSTPVVSDLTGTLGIDSQQLLTDELVEIEGQRNRLLMAQGKAILESCAELLQKQGSPDVLLMQKHGTPDEVLAELSDLRLMVLGRRGSQHPVGSHLESVIRLQKKPLALIILNKKGRVLSPFVTRTRLVQPVTFFINYLLTVLFRERAFLRIGKNIQHDFRRAA